MTASCQRIVVTGAAGFVGSALVSRLRRDGHDVLATDKFLAEGFAGDLGDPALLTALFAEPVDAVVHLATVAGGAAEGDPKLGFQVNIDGTHALIEAASPHRPRFLFASSIAVFGHPLPPLVDDETPVAPQLLYGAHKAMIEEWIGCQSRRGAIDGLSLRLPGIVARPRGPSGMISAFMSDVFHALRAGESINLPVSPEATLWLLSRGALVEALIHGLSIAIPPEQRRLTLPALRLTMGELVHVTAERAGTSPALVTFEPISSVEDGFGHQPPLHTPRADALGFRADASVAALVETVFKDLDGADT